MMTHTDCTINPDNFSIQHPAWCSVTACVPDDLTGEGLDLHVRTYGPLFGTVTRQGYAGDQPRVSMLTSEQLEELSDDHLHLYAQTLAGALEDTDRACALLGEEVASLRRHLTGRPDGTICDVDCPEHEDDELEEVAEDSVSFSTVIDEHGIHVDAHDGLTPDTARSLARLLLHSARTLEMMQEGE